MYTHPDAISMPDFYFTTKCKPNFFFKKILCDFLVISANVSVLYLFLDLWRI